MVKIEKGAVLAPLGGGGEFASEEGLQDGGGGGVHRDFDRDRFATLARPDTVAAGWHVLDVVRERRAFGKGVGEGGV